MNYFKERYQGIATVIFRVEAAEGCFILADRFAADREAAVSNAVY